MLGVCMALIDDDEDKIDFETEGGNDRLFLCVNVYIG
mgnify:CR=1 FL=1